MGITAGTLTATTTLSDALGDPGMQAWLAGSGTDMGGIEFLKTVLSNFQDGLDLPFVANLDLGTIASESHGLDFTVTGTLASGKGMVGGNFAVTTAGTAGAWVSGIYAKVTQGATKNVNGYISGAEFEVVNAADNVSDWFVLVLNASNSGAQQGSHSSYIALRDYGDTDIQSLLWVSSDLSVGTKSDTSLITTFADGTHITHAIRIIVDATPHWILCSNVAPSGT